MGALISACLYFFGVSLGVMTTLHAYGLEIHSWPWLIFGNLATFLMLGIAGVISAELKS